MNRKTFFKQIGLIAGGCLCLPFVSLTTVKKTSTLSAKEYHLQKCREVYRNHIKRVTPLVNSEEYNKYMEKANLEYFKRTLKKTLNETYNKD